MNVFYVQTIVYNYKIFDVGRSSNAELLAKWCGKKDGETVESSGSYMYLKVVTDDENFARGFKLLVSAALDAGNNIKVKCYGKYETNLVKHKGR